jgi:hypothetical protein
MMPPSKRYVRFALLHGRGRFGACFYSLTGSCMWEKSNCNECWGNFLVSLQIRCFKPVIREKWSRTTFVSKGE